MEAITKADFARTMGVSHTTLCTCTRKYKEVLEYLKEERYKFNYRAVLFLCHELVIDLTEFYPKLDRVVLEAEQTKVMNEVYENTNYERRG